MGKVMSLLAASFLALLLADSKQLGPGNHYRTLELDKYTRSYWAHVPPGYDGKKAVPVVLALHGATMSAKSMEMLSGLNKKADEAGFIVVYPNGTGPNPVLLTWNSGGF